MAAARTAARKVITTAAGPSVNKAIARIIAADKAIARIIAAEEAENAITEALSTEAAKVRAKQAVNDATAAVKKAIERANKASSKAKAAAAEATKKIVLSATNNITIKVNEEKVGAKAAQAAIEEVSETLNDATAASKWLVGRRAALAATAAEAQVPQDGVRDWVIGEEVAKSLADVLDLEGEEIKVYQHYCQNFSSRPDLTNFLDYLKDQRGLVKDKVVCYFKANEFQDKMDLANWCALKGYLEDYLNKSSNSRFKRKSFTRKLELKEWKASFLEYLNSKKDGDLKVTTGELVDNLIESFDLKRPNETVNLINYLRIVTNWAEKLKREAIFDDIKIRNEEIKGDVKQKMPSGSRFVEPADAGLILNFDDDFTEAVKKLDLKEVFQIFARYYPLQRDKIIKEIDNLYRVYRDENEGVTHRYGAFNEQLKKAISQVEKEAISQVEKEAISQVEDAEKEKPEVGKKFLLIFFGNVERGFTDVYLKNETLDYLIKKLT